MFDRPEELSYQHRGRTPLRPAATSSEKPGEVEKPGEQQVSEVFQILFWSLRLLGTHVVKTTAQNLENLENH